LQNSLIQPAGPGLPPAGGSAGQYPILNGGSLKIGYAKSKENLRNYELQQQLDNLTLKQNIYQAYNLASAAREKFEANKKHWPPPNAALNIRKKDTRSVC